MGHAEARWKAVIVTGNPRFVRGSQRVRRFYLGLAAFLRQRGFSPVLDRGEDFTLPDTAAAIRIGHSRGAGRLRFAPAHVKRLALGSLEPGSVNHPDDDVFTPFHLTGGSPPPAHYVFTDDMREAVAALTRGDA